MRWRHPERGLVPPGDFIPLAEDNGRIIPIGRWVIQEAVRQAAAWRAAGDPALEPLRVAVNVSRRQLSHPSLLADVESALDAHGLPPDRLVVEVTESALMDDPRRAHRTLAALSELGVPVSLDDFGTGHSSLASVRDFPLEILKLDRSFLPAADGWVIVRAVLEMAHALGLDAVAEGIERPDQVAGLERLGCRFGQGFHFSPPVPAEEIVAVVAQINAGLTGGVAVVVVAA